MIEQTPITEADQEKLDYDEVRHWRDENGELIDEKAQHQAVEALKAARERIRTKLLKGDYDETN